MEFLSSNISASPAPLSVKDIVGFRPPDVPVAATPLKVFPLVAGVFAEEAVKEQKSNKLSDFAKRSMNKVYFLV